MGITYNGSTPTSITYNGNNVTKVLYNGTQVWPDVEPTPTGTYKKISEDGTTLYLRGTPADGYTKYTGSLVTGSLSGNRTLTSVVVESECLLPASSASMFSSCKQVTSIDITKFDISNITNISRMFDDCEALTSLNLSSWDTSNITHMNYMFCQCYSLTQLDLSGWDTSKVTSMNAMFDRCKALTSLNISNFDTNNVTDMQYMFKESTSLQHIYVGTGWNTAQVISSDYMFENDTALHNYNSSYTDKTKAIIDDGTNGGYLESI